MACRRHSIPYFAASLKFLLAKYANLTFHAVALLMGPMFGQYIVLFEAAGGGACVGMVGMVTLTSLLSLLRLLTRVRMMMLSTSDEIANATADKTATEMGNSSVDKGFLK